MRKGEALVDWTVKSACGVSSGDKGPRSTGGRISRCGDLLGQGPRSLPEARATCSMPSFGEGGPQSHSALGFKTITGGKQPLESAFTARAPAQEV